MNQSGPDPEQFIIPDEDTGFTKRPAAVNSPLGNSSSSFGNSSAGSLANKSSTPFWVPKIDLSAYPLFPGETRNPQKVERRQYQGNDTLDEPVWHTLRRELVQIGRRLALVVWPVQLQKMARQQQAKLADFAAKNGVLIPGQVPSTAETADALESGTSQNGLLGALDWDLWGPLIFSLSYSVAVGLSASSLQKNFVFSMSFLFIWFFYLVTGANTQLLGGTVSFYSAISLTGYLMFPTVVGAVLSVLLLNRGWIRVLIMTVAAIWSIYAGLLSLRCSGVKMDRYLLAIYPVVYLNMILAFFALIA